MYTKAAVASFRFVLGAGAVACTLFAGSVAAGDYEVSVTLPATTRGLDLRQPAGVQKFYARLQHAARVVCTTHGDRVDLVPSRNPEGCYEKALGDAVRSVNVPPLTLFYLKTHTLSQAASHGITVPGQIAAK
jgi:UrcA family protein